MRDGIPSTVRLRSLGRSPRVSSWLGATLLADQVPVDGAVFEESDGQEIPEKLTLSVPVSSQGRSWDPTGDPTHPLACYGQRLNVVLDVRTPRGQSWEVPVGWFQVDSWKLSDDESRVDVTALGLLVVVAEATFRGAEQPRAGGTFASEIRRLMPGGIPVSISPDLTDRACPSSFTWDEDRLSAIHDLVEAWPARMMVSADGTVMVLPPLGLTPEPLLTLTDGSDGVLMSAPRADSREGRYNAVVARSSADDSDSTPVEGEYESLTGPYAVTTYGVVRRRVASPLLASTTAAQSLARTVAEDSQRQARLVTVELPPDPRIQRGDALALVWGEDTYQGWVRRATLPLTVKGAAPMTLTVECPL